MPERLLTVFSLYGFCSIIFFATGIMNIENYFNWIGFTVCSILFGVILGMIIYYCISLFEPDVRNYKNAKGFRLIHILIFSFVLTSFAICRYINEYKNNDSNCRKYVIKELGKSGTRHSAYYVFINTKNGIERLSFGKAFNENHKPGDSISLCLMKGRLGFEYYKIKKQ